MIEFIRPLYNLLQQFSNHYLRLDTLDFSPYYTNPLLLYYWNQSLCYIASGRTPQKTRPLPNSGRLLLSRIVVRFT
jgi:hypothetical protein